MAEIKLASGKKVKEIRAFINGRWTKTKGRVFYRGKWEEFSRPEIQMIDNIKTIEMARVLKNTARISGDKYIIDTITNYSLSHNILPSFYEWGVSDSKFVKILDDNKVIVDYDPNATSGGQQRVYYIFTIKEPGTYKVSIECQVEKNISKNQGIWVAMRNLESGNNILNVNSKGSPTLTREIILEKNVRYNIRLFNDSRYHEGSKIYKNVSLIKIV